MTISGVITTSLEFLLLSQLGPEHRNDQLPRGAEVASGSRPGSRARASPRSNSRRRPDPADWSGSPLLVHCSVLGHRISAGEAWHIALPRLPALLGTTLLAGLAYIGPWARYAIVLIVLGIGGAPRGGGGSSLLLSVGIAALVLDAWFWVTL